MPQDGFFPAYELAVFLYDHQADDPFAGGGAPELYEIDIVNEDNYSGYRDEYVVIQFPLFHQVLQGIVDKIGNEHVNEECSHPAPETGIHVLF